MEGRAAIVSVVGEDSYADLLRAELEARGVGHGGLVTDPGRRTTIKTRIIAHNQQMLRVDREERSPISPAVEERVLEQAERELADASAVLLSDYSKGVLTPRVMAELLRRARELGRPVFANPKPATIGHYRGLDLVQLNQSEAEAVAGFPLTRADAVERAGRRLLEQCDCGSAVITLGDRGLALFERGSESRNLPVLPVEVYDSCGCGDSAIAAATLARTAGATWVEAATLANLAGQAKVRKLGVVPVTRIEMEKVWALGHALANGKAR
ncbi:MAG: hypothetical protein FJX77_17415 [Armatimonadetes bacterium]|nr:hypothetical protein [Armatimonadota bacterium]